MSHHVETECGHRRGQSCTCHAQKGTVDFLSLEPFSHLAMAAKFYIISVNTVSELEDLEST